MKNNTNKNKNKKSNKSIKKNQIKTGDEIRLMDEIAAIILLALGIFLAISLHTNWTGYIGHALGNTLKGIFGLGSIMLPYFLIVYSFIIFFGKAKPFKLATSFLFIGMFLVVDLINGIRFVPNMKYGILGVMDVYKEGTQLKNGGLFAMYIDKSLVNLIGSIGAYIFLIVMTVIFFLLIVKTPFSKAYKEGKNKKEIITERRNQKKLKKEELKKKKDEEYLKKLARQKEILKHKREMEEERHKIKEVKKNKNYNFPTFDRTDSSLKDNDYSLDIDNSDFLNQKKYSEDIIINTPEPIKLEGFKEDTKADNNEFVGFKSNEYNSDFINKTKAQE